jgi:hypothetical protein
MPRHLAAGIGAVGTIDMRHLLARGVLCVFAGVTVPAAAADNLIFNGSFEEKAVDTDPGFHRGAPPPSSWLKATDIDLPDVIGNAYIDFYATQPVGYRTYLKAQDGKQFLDMNGAGRFGAIYQEVTGLTTDKTVTLTFWVGAWAENVDGGLTVLLREPGGAGTIASKEITAPILPGPSTAKWTQYSMTGTVGATGKLAVFFSGVSTGVDRAALGLDNVRLEYAVPEPATWATMIAGFAIAGAALRQRSKRMNPNRRQVAA